MCACIILLLFHPTLQDEGVVEYYNGDAWMGPAGGKHTHVTPPVHPSLLPPRATTGAYVQLRVKDSRWQGWYPRCPLKSASILVCGCTGGSDQESTTAAFGPGKMYADSDAARDAVLKWIADQHSVHCSGAP